MKLKTVFFLSFLMVSLVIVIPKTNSQQQETHGSFGSTVTPTFFNWTKFWNLFNSHSAWDLEYNNGSGWISDKSMMQVIKNYSMVIDEQRVYNVNKTRASSVKITLNFTAKYDADYRLTFGIDLDVKNYTHKENSWNYTLSYQNYTVMFDWTDIKDLPLDSVNHGIEPVGDESYFWFRIRKNNVNEGVNVVIDPSFGNTSEESGGTSILNSIKGSPFTCPESGTATTITAYIDTFGNARNVKCAIYLVSDNSSIGYTEEISVNNNGFEWEIFSIIYGGSLINTQYYLVAWGEGGNLAQSYSPDAGVQDDETYNGFPNPLVPTVIPRLCSIYANYTVSGEQTENFYGEVTATFSINKGLGWSLNRYGSVTSTFTIGSYNTWEFSTSGQIPIQFIIGHAHSFACYIQGSVSPVFTVGGTFLTGVFKNFFGEIIATFTINGARVWNLTRQSAIDIVVSIGSTQEWITNILNLVGQVILDFTVRGSTDLPVPQLEFALVLAAFGCILAIVAFIGVYVSRKQDET